MPSNRKTKHTRPSTKPPPPLPFNREHRISELQSFLKESSYARHEADIQEALRLYQARRLPKLNTRRAVFQYGRFIGHLEEIDNGDGVWVEEYPFQSPPTIREKLESIPLSGRTARPPRRIYAPSDGNLAFLIFVPISLILTLTSTIMCTAFDIPCIAFLSLLYLYLHISMIHEWWRLFWDCAYQSGWLFKWIRYLECDREDGVPISETW
ncbi:hypothetical protein BDV06DRAFT_136965 [Aspergillus oleicola]